MTPADRRRPNRILILASELPPGPGGIGSHAHDLARALQRMGEEVRLLGPQHYCTAEERDAFNRSSPVPISTLNRGSRHVASSLDRYRQVNRELDAFGPDVVLASGRAMLWLAATICPPRRDPVVAVVHGTEVADRSRWRHLTRWALDRMTSVVAVSHYTADHAGTLGVPARSITVMHNGADGSRFAPDAHRRDRFRTQHHLGDTRLILTVGNVTERKGQHLIVEALPQILERVPDAHYVLVGRPTDGDRIQRLSYELGVGDRVHLLGQVDAGDVVSAHCAADVFAMTSTATASGDVEGYGIAVTEAALCGIPAVVTRGTGAAEAIVDERTGLLADTTPPSIAQTVSDLLIDEPRRRSMGVAAQERARAEGTWDAVAVSYRAEIERVVAGTRPRILVVSHTDHYRAENGTTVGFGPTLRELDRLSTLASELVHIAPLHPGPPPGNALEIGSPNVRHVPVRPAGGPRTADRLRAVAVVPEWALTIHREMRRADVVHVRAPAGIAMVAMALLTLRRRPTDRWIKYAGNWCPDDPDAVTYRLQRAWLRRGWCRAQVTVNGRWPDQPPFVHAFDNPTLTDEEVERGRRAAANRQSGPPFRAVFVGRLEEAKGADVAVEIVERLQVKGFDLRLDLIGDGPLRQWIEGRNSVDIDKGIHLHGWLQRPEVEQYLETAHLLLLPTRGEGFPKVVAEALAFGAVPVTSDVSSMAQVLGETGGAVVVRDATASDWVDAVRGLLTDGSLGRLSAEGPHGAGRFTYERYLSRVRELAATAWGRRL